MTDKGEGQPDHPKRCGECAAWEPANPDPLAVVGKCMGIDSRHYGWRRQYASEACGVGLKRQD